MKIKVYITESSQGRLQMPTREYERIAPHGAMSCQSGILLDDPVYIDDNCKKAIDTVIDFAEKNKIKYKLYSVKNDWPKFCAWIEGIKVFPTVVIRKKKIEGVPKIEELEKIINSMNAS